MRLSLYLLLFILLVGTGCGGSSNQNNTNSDDSDKITSLPADTSIARTVTVDAYKSVENVVLASSYLKFKDDAPEFEALVPYIKGSIKGKYVSDILDGSAISFDVKVPDDNVTYGSYAGKTVNYVGCLFYATTLDANYSSASNSTGWEIPSDYSQMETTIDAEPLFSDSTKKYPLVVYSHGVGGEILTTGKQMHKLATHGYIVLGLFHGDERFNSYGGEVYSPEHITLRSLSIKTAIDFLQSSKYNSHIDFDKIGALGNSYGGSTSFILAGAKPVNLQSSVGGVLSDTVSDSRIKVGVGIEPFMGDENFPEVMGSLVTFFGWASSGAASVTTPYLAITGTADDVAVERYTKAALAKTSSSAHLVSMESESHEMTEEGSSTAETWALHFLNYYLKGDDTFLTIKDVSGDPVDTYTSPY